MKRLFVLTFLVLALLLTACGGDETVVREIVEVVITATPKPAPKPVSTPIPQAGSGNPTVNEVFSMLPDTGLECEGPRWEKDVDGDYSYYLFCYDDMGTIDLDDDFAWSVDAYAVGWGRDLNNPIDMVAFSVITDLGSPDKTYEGMGEALADITGAIFQNDIQAWDNFDTFWMDEMDETSQENQEKWIDGHHFIGTISNDGESLMFTFFIGFPEADYDTSLRPQT
jgi:hypothetical protein